MSNDNLDETPQAQAETAEAVESAAESAAAEQGSEENLFSQLQTDVERFRDLAMRTQADFENYRKRAAREKDEAIKFANGTLLEKLIPVLDNFEFGLQAARAEGSQAILIGFEMVSKQLQEFLAGNGVEVIDAEGKPFDPNLHDALGQEPSDTVPEGQVIRQIRKGYKLRDRLIRPANVFVSKGQPQPEEPAK